MGLSLTVLIPNQSLINVLIQTLKEISSDLQEFTGHDYVSCIQSISRPSATIQGVTGGMCETSGECSLGQTISI